MYPPFHELNISRSDRVSSLKRSWMKNMNHLRSLVPVAGMLLLFALVVVPVAADISGFSPMSAYRGESISLTITGTDFNTSLVKYVRLYNSDTTNITDSSISSKTSTQIVARFSIGSSKEKGDWYVVVVNSDGSEEMSSDAFIIYDEMTLSSISPTYARTNNDSVSFTVTGSDLSDVESVYLYKSGEDNVSASDVSAASSTVTGTFDLSSVDEATYKVCVEDSYGNVKCDSSVTFEVTTDQVGEIDVSSSPTGANVYLDSSYIGTTPYAITDVDTGSHVIKVTKDGYLDWSEIVKVTDGDTTTINAGLTEQTTTVETPVPTTIPPMMVTTQKTPLPVTTIKVPTPIATATAATTKASPVEAGVIIGATGVGMLILHRKH